MWMESVGGKEEDGSAERSDCSGGASRGGVSGRERDRCGGRVEGERGDMGVESRSGEEGGGGDGCMGLGDSFSGAAKEEEGKMGE